MAKKKVKFISYESGNEIEVRDTDRLELGEVDLRRYQHAAGITPLQLDYVGGMLEEKVYKAQEGIKPEPYPSMDRDKNGQFRNGNQGGPGNPHARRVAELRKVLLDEVSVDNLKMIMAALLAKAKEGDVPAAKLVLQYTIGKPTAAPDPDHLDVEEWKLTKQSGLEPEEVTKAGRQVPVKEALKGTNILRDIFYVGQREAMGEKLCQHVELNGWQRDRFAKLDKELAAKEAKLAKKDPPSPGGEGMNTATSLPGTDRPRVPARAGEPLRAPSANGSIPRPAGL